jgi:hypothetical protein
VLFPVPKAFLAAQVGGEVDADLLGVAMCFLDGRQDAQGEDARRAAARPWRRG